MITTLVSQTESVGAREVKTRELHERGRRSERAGCLIYTALKERKGKGERIVTNLYYDYVKNNGKKHSMENIYWKYKVNERGMGKSDQ